MNWGERHRHCDVVSWGSHKHKQCDIIQSGCRQTWPLCDWQVGYAVCMPWTKEWFILLASGFMRRHHATPGEHFQHYELSTSVNFHLIFLDRSWSHIAETGKNWGMKNYGLGLLTSILPIWRSFSLLSSLCVLGFSVYSTLKRPKRSHPLEFSINGHLGWLTRWVDFVMLTWPFPQEW